MKLLLCHSLFLNMFFGFWGDEDWPWSIFQYHGRFAANRDVAGFSAVNSGWKLRGWKFSEKMDPGIIINNNASTSAKICDSSESLKARNDGTGMNWVQKCEHQTWGLSVSTQQCSSQMPQTYASSLFKVNVLLQIAFSRYHAYSEYRCLMVV